MLRKHAKPLTSAASVPSYFNTKDRGATDTLTPYASDKHGVQSMDYFIVTDNQWKVVDNVHRHT